MPPAPAIPASVRLIMAALIAAVRTARIEDREYMGAGSPRMAAAVANSFQLANRLCAYAEQHWPEWFRATAPYPASPRSGPGNTSPSKP